MDISEYRITEGKGFHIKRAASDDTGGFKGKSHAESALDDNISALVDLQEKLYAHNQYGVLIILQAMDAAGKDGAIKHVMSGLNPQGVQVKAFKAPSAEELDHDYLWRSNTWLPARGNIAIFNRSYYEDVIVVKVHKLLTAANLPPALAGPGVWERRYRQIRDYERYLTENGIVVIKFFLNISRAEQGQRLLARIDDPMKNWKFSAADIHERQYWNQYMDTYEEMIRGTASGDAPWYIIPADHKWFSRLLISEILVKTLQKLPLAWPAVAPETHTAMAAFRKQLLGEAPPAQEAAAISAQTKADTKADTKAEVAADDVQGER